MTTPITVQGTGFSSAPQIHSDDLPAIVATGYRAIVCNRPDGEGGVDQPTSDELAAAARTHRLAFAYLPVVPGQISDAQVDAFTELLRTLPGPVLGYCRSGARATTLYQRSQAHSTPTASPQPDLSFDVVIVGAGAAGIGVAASLLRRRRHLKVALIDPSDSHHYQPAWTLVGGGAFDPARTVRPMESLIPSGATWLHTEATALTPTQCQVTLADGRRIGYQQLIVCPGLRLAWERIEGLTEALGKNGVTSNYRRDLTPYTWELVQGLQRGKALFSQPPMPIKCAGAPQKAMYLSADHWLRRGVLKDIDIELDLAGPTLFGVDGPSRTAWFDVKQADGTVRREPRSFDLLHAVPPQVPPELVRTSPLAEFGYGGKLLPTFPLDPTVARASAWWLKTRVLPWVYWNLLLRGREWLTHVARA